VTKTKPLATIEGWVLVARDEFDDDPEWYIAWTDFFRSKKVALDFAKTHGWPKPYRAVRGRMIAD
jgi:hypothetical protein